MKGIKGVDTVDVSLNKGSATMTFTPNNSVSMKQLQDAIARNGFTTKESRVIVRGELAASKDGYTLKVTGSNELFTLLPPDKGASDPRQFVGKVVEVVGVMPEATKGKTADTVRYQAITEVK